MENILCNFVGIESSGYCLNKDGNDQNTGVELLEGTFTKLGCIKECVHIQINYPNLNMEGCEYDSKYGKCAYHTEPVSSGSGDSRDACWVRKQGVQK